MYQPLNFGLAHEHSGSTSRLLLSHTGVGGEREELEEGIEKEKRVEQDNTVASH